MRDDPTLKERVIRELNAHAENDVLAESYRLKNRFSHIWTYPSRLRLMNEMSALLNDISGKVVLDYGCGRGESSMRYLSTGANVKGIDISPVYIADAARKAEESGFSDQQYQFLTMDAHELNFENCTFDLVVGEGILHHLDSEVALKEIRRVLKPGGRVLLLEPMADNPLLKVFRILTPRARTKDEMPFSGVAIRRLTRTDWWRSETSYCGVLEAPAAMITSVIMPSRPNNIFLRTADKLELWMRNHDVLLSWNQYVLLNLVKR